MMLTSFGAFAEHEVSVVTYTLPVAEDVADAGEATMKPPATTLPSASAATTRRTRFRLILLSRRVTSSPPLIAPQLRRGTLQIRRCRVEDAGGIAMTKPGAHNRLRRLRHQTV